MALRDRKRKINKPRLATTARMFQAFARRPIVVGTVVTVLVLATFAVNSLPSAPALPLESPGSAPTLPLKSPGSAPAMVYVPAGDRLVPVDAVLTAPPGPHAPLPRQTAQSGHAFS